MKIYLWPPSGNHTWQIGKGRARLSEKTKTFRLAMKSWMLAQRNYGIVPKEPITGDIKVKLTFYPPDRRRRDLENFEKTFNDALTKAGLWLDDSQIKHKEVVWGEVFKGGAVLVELEQI